MATLLYNKYKYEITSFDGRYKFETDANSYNSLVSNSGNKLGWTVTVLDMQYVKETYRPCHLTLRLSISDNQYASDVQLLKMTEVFAKASVRVTAQRDNAETVIIDQYYVMSVEPIMKPNRAYELILDAYSADYQLSLDKYSDCYLNMPLDKIISESINKIGQKKGLHFDLGFSCDINDGLQFINYQNGDEQTSVYHTPYAVQYNETFYDFMARMAQRYGEFLYFESGSLHLGIDPAHVQVTHEISNDPSKPGYKSFSRVTKPESLLGENVFGSHYDYLNSETFDQSNAFNYDLDYAEDMYMDSLDKGDLGEDENNWQMYIDWVGMAQKCLSFLTSFRREENGVWHYHIGNTINISTAILKLGIEWGTAIINAQKSEKETNDSYKEAIEALEKANGFVADEQKDGESFRPFASYTIEESVLNTNRDTLKSEYDDIVKNRETQEAALKQNKLAEAEKAFSGVQAEASKLVATLAAFEPKVETGKEDILNLLTMAISIEKEAIEANLNKPGSCMNKILEAKNNLDLNINDCRLKDAEGDAGLVNDLIAEALSRIEEFNKVFTFDDEKTFSDYYLLTDFCQTTPLAEGEPTTEERKKLAASIKATYDNLKALLQEAINQLNVTQSATEEILKAAKELFTIDQNERETLANLLNISVRISKRNLLHKYLESIEKAEAKVAAQRISLEIDNSNYTKMPLLGETVLFGGTKYLIIKIESQVILNKENRDTKEMLKLELIPEIKQGDEKQGNTDDETKNSHWIPAETACRERPKVGAMIAVVTNNADPLAMGRLRLRFKWQHADGAESPWIRMSTPYSSGNGAGLFFTPNVGDEVLVDFYNGNIERPIVAGVLRNNQTDRDYTAGWNKRRQIVSASGQSVSFDEEGEHAFINVIKAFPGLGSIFSAYAPNFKESLSFIENAAKDQDNDFARYMHGGLSMSDNFGTWEVSGNTGNREVSISSNLGTISLNALTGISIEAPLGDISISAKNISIEATNNISIESGKQIQRQRKIKETYSEGIGAGLYGAAKGILSDYTKLATIDFSMIRFFFEALIPPVEGTLQVKSNRYLKLEAGAKAEADEFAKLPMTGGDDFSLTDTIKGGKSFDARAELYDKAEDLKKLNKALNSIPGNIQTICQDRHLEGFEYKSDLQALKNSYTKIEDKINDPDETGWGMKDMSDNDINNLDDDGMNSLIKKITKLDTDDAINNAFSPSQVRLMTAIFNSSRPAEETKKEFLAPFKKKFIKQAYEVAKKLFDQADVYASAKSDVILRGMGFTDTTAGTMKSWKLDETTLTLTENNIKASDLRDVFTPLLEQIYSFKDVAGAPANDKFKDKTFQDRVARVFLLAVINATGWYVYKKEYAEAAYKSNGNIPTGIPDDNFVSSSASSDIKYFSTNNQAEDQWEHFTKGCKFMSDHWRNVEQKPGKLRTVFGELSDIFGISEIADDGAAIWKNVIKESAQIKSSVHGGRVLISDNGVSVGITKQGGTELTSLDLGASNWK